MDSSSWFGVFSNLHQQYLGQGAREPSEDVKTEDVGDAGFSSDQASQAPGNRSSAAVNQSIQELWGKRRDSESTVDVSSRKRKREDSIEDASSKRQRTAAGGPSNGTSGIQPTQKVSGVGAVNLGQAYKAEASDRLGRSQERKRKRGDEAVVPGKRQRTGASGDVRADGSPASFLATGTLQALARVGGELASWAKGPEVRLASERTFQVLASVGRGLDSKTSQYVEATGLPQKMFGKAASMEAIRKIDPSINEGWLTARQIPVEILRQPDLLELVFTSRLYESQMFEETPMKFNVLTQDVEVLVEGTYMASREFLDTFEVVDFDPERISFVPEDLRQDLTPSFQIKHKQSGKTYENRAKGLVEHDQPGEVRVFKSYRGAKFNTQVCFDLKVISPHGDLKAHTTTRITNEDGRVYHLNNRGMDFLRSTVEKTRRRGQQ